MSWGMNESHLSLESTIEALVSCRVEMSEIATEEKISSIRTLVFSSASED